ncbi:MAG: hypothetical protein R8G34_08230 [Paracoccaceae bacterium]|nr:hypothetical protein [Paracoccaceae bacterium]
MITNEKPLAPKDASLGAHLWLAALMLPALILAVTVVQAPSLYDGRIEIGAITASETEPVPLWSDTGKRVWFTTADLLHPEDFGVDGPRIDTVVMNLWPRGSPHWNAQTSLLKIRKLLDMRLANGEKIPGLRPTTEDLVLKAKFVEFLRDGTGPEFERPVFFSISPNSTTHQRTGLYALVFTAVPAPDERDAAVALERALLAAAARAAEVGAAGLGISCSSSATGSCSYGADSWSALLDAVYALPQNGNATIMLGGRALTLGLA